MQWADPGLVAQAAQSWNSGQLDCRIAGHHDWNRRNTVLTRARGNVLTVQQTCGRRCGVKRRAEMDQRTGHLLTQWRPDYSEARNYLLRGPAEGERVGRIDADGRAAVRRMAWADLTVIEVPDE